ncbi:MAG: dihydrolipoyllysine-residue acetyltransferase [Pseudomonadales bacterium]
MTQDIRIPDIGDADDVEVVEILAAAGDQVGEDDPIIVIESDKASMEVPAGLAGVIESVTVAVGDKVTEGQVIARLADGSDASAGAASKQDQDDDEPEREDPGQDKGERADEVDEGDQKQSAPSDERADAPSAGAGSRTVEVKVPDIGDAEGVEVIEVAVKAGDRVDVDDVLVVVESDKASMEIPSSHAGTVREVHVSTGSEVEEGTLLVTLETAADEAGATKSAAPAPAPAAAESEKPRSAAAPAGRKAPDESSGKSGRETDRVVQASTGEPGRTPEQARGSGTDVYAGPAVRRLARELGVDLSSVEGTGNRGRIVKDDVKAHVKSRLSGSGAAAGSGAAVGLPAMPEVDFSRFGEIEEQPLSRIRARGAENLHRAWLNIPHVTNHDEVDITDLEDFRASLKAEGERRGVRVTPVAFIIKACCHALQEFPTVNASLDPAAKTFILKRYYNIGMAVDTPDGLVVPVIKDAERKGIWALSEEIAELAEKARNKKLGVGDLQGGSFSVSSLGAIGGTGFTPIINAPELAILGVGRLTTRPVWLDGAVVPRKMLPLSLSYDHRAINGAEAGRFLARLGELLSDVRRLAL